MERAVLDVLGSGTDAEKMEFGEVGATSSEATSRRKTQEKRGQEPRIRGENREAWLTRGRNRGAKTAVGGQ